MSKEPQTTTVRTVLEGEIKRFRNAAEFAEGLAKDAAARHKSCETQAASYREKANDLQKHLNEMEPST